VAATLLSLVVLTTGGLPLAAQLPDALGWVRAHAVLIVPLVVAALALVALLARRARAGLRRVWAEARQGGAILRTPGRFLHRVVVVQAAAWACRVGVVFCLLCAFSLPASVPAAATVMILCGASALVPLTPGGAGTQQVLVTYALGHAGTAAGVLAFSLGMQAGITAVSAALGVAGAMIAFRTLHPLAALRSGLRLARTPAAP
jgi:uncharacterized membrane protein YbhN (UPF0104 family)